MKIKFFKTIFLTMLLSIIFFPIKKADALIIDHTSADAFDQIPQSAIIEAKALRLSYNHTSHGDQLISGAAKINADFFDEISATAFFTTSSLYDYYESGISTSFLCESCINNGGSSADIQYSGWESITSNYLAALTIKPNVVPNVVMFSWCGALTGGDPSKPLEGTEEYVDDYLSKMSILESSYSNVKFVYMTGHLDGTGVGGNLNLRNEQIRNYAINNNKILYDFADIESYDPAGTKYPNDTDACNWCTSWCNAHTGTDAYGNECSKAMTDCTADYPASYYWDRTSILRCAHSHCLNCYRKGKAFWYMMARLAGWDGIEQEGDTTSPSSPTGLSVI